VLTEFVHVVTDARRFQEPFSMETALNKSERWWNAAEADQVLPTDVAIRAFPYLDAASSTWPEACARHIACRDLPRGGRQVASDVERDGFHSFW
jgi:hypothetical protein